MSSNTDNFNWDDGWRTILKVMNLEPGFLVQHQINPFNDFLDKGLKNVIEQFNPIILNYDYVMQQKFYKFKETSKYSNNTEWIEYKELSDIYKMFKDDYSIINKLNLKKY